MRAAGCLAVLAGTGVLAGCMGSAAGEETARGEPLTKAQYEANLQPLPDPFTGGGCAEPNYAVRYATIAKNMRARAGLLEGMTPPDEVAEIHESYVKGLLLEAEELDKAAAAAREVGDTADAESLEEIARLVSEQSAQAAQSANLATVVPELQEAAEGFQAEGYDVDQRPLEKLTYVAAANEALAAIDPIRIPDPEDADALRAEGEKLQKAGRAIVRIRPSDELLLAHADLVEGICNRGEVLRSVAEFSDEARRDAATQDEVRSLEDYDTKLTLAREAFRDQGYMVNVPTFESAE